LVSFCFVLFHQIPNVPFQLFAALEKDHYRKPLTGMFDYYQDVVMAKQFGEGAKVGEFGRVEFFCVSLLPFFLVPSLFISTSFSSRGNLSLPLSLSLSWPSLFKLELKPPLPLAAPDRYRKLLLRRRRSRTTC